MPASRTPWWRVAAVVTIIASGGLLTYQLTRTTNESAEKNVAAVESESPITATDSAGTTITLGTSDSIRAKGNIVYKKNQPGAASDQGIQLQSNSAASPQVYSDTQSLAVADVEVAGSYDAKNESIVKAETEKLLAENKSALQKDEQLTSERKRSMAKAAAPAPVNQFSGKVVDQSGDPLPFATVTVPKKAIAVATDKEGKFSLRDADTVIKVEVASVGYQKAIAQIRKDEPAKNITLEEEDQSLSEVVVSGYSTKRKKQVVASQSTSTGATPLVGWPAFERYVKQKADSLKQQGNYTWQPQQVTLVFKINDNGKPTNIHTINKVDKAVKNAAINILASGPLWTRSTNSKRATVVIKL